MMKFVLGVLFGYLFTRELENRQIMIETADTIQSKIEIYSQVLEKKREQMEREANRRLFDFMYTIVG